MAIWSDPRVTLISTEIAEGVWAQVGRVEEGARGQGLSGESRGRQVRRGGPRRQVSHSRTRGLLSQ